MDSVVSRDAQIQLSEYMLEFVRASIFDNTPKISGDVSIDWDELMDLSAEQGLLAWVWDGICKLPQEQQPSRIQRINWGLSVQELLSNNHHQKKVLQDIVDKCNKHGIKVLLLKGLSLAELYPKPEFRPSADIDLYFFDDCLRAATILSDGQFTLEGKHYVFEIEGVQVECHEHLIDQGTAFQKNVEFFLESTLDKSMLQVEGYYVLPQWSNVIYTLLHILAHLNNPGPDPLKIRSILDYAMLINMIVKEGRVPEYHEIIRKVSLNKASDLFVKLSEWILQQNYKCLYSIIDSSKDLEQAKQLLLDDSIRYPQFDKHSFCKQCIQRTRFYLRNRWRYAYLPTLERHRLWGEIRLQSHIFIKFLLGFPFDKPFHNTMVGKNKQKHLSKDVGNS